MWEGVSREAIDDVGTHANVAGEIDHLGVVHTQSWSYDDPVGRLSERLGQSGIGGTYSILAGTSPQRLLDAAAAAMMRGEVSVALVVGAEAQATLTRMAAVNDAPRWSYPHPAPVGVLDMVDEWYLPTEIRHGVLPAWLTFALLDQARWAARGGRSEDRLHSYESLARLSETASRNADAWFRIRRTAAELATATQQNRMVARPFTKLMTAFPKVDMAAANLLVTEEVADRWKVPDDRRVYLRGWGFERDAAHVAARLDLASSPAMRHATQRALAVAGLHQEQIDAFDLYSCFAPALSFARDAIGMSPSDPRPLSLTGGLPYYGGPGSNYMSHGLSYVVDHLRAHPGASALVTGIGMHMTKHVAAVWSTEPGTGGLPRADERQQAAHTEVADPVVVRDEVDSTVSIEAATVVHGRTLDPPAVVAVCRLPDGSRCYARSDHPEVIATVDADDWPQMSASAKATSNGVNVLLPN